jgi:hypothetical protein
MLYVMEPGRSPGGIVLRTVTGPRITVIVDAIDIEIAMTDDVAFSIRRVSSRLGESDSRWED